MSSTHVSSHTGMLVRSAPTSNGINSTVYIGKGIFVTCARMIFVATRPNTIPVVKANRMKCLSRKMYEWGEASHKYPQREYNMIENSWESVARNDVER